MIADCRSSRAQRAAHDPTPFSLAVSAGVALGNRSRRVVPRDRGTAAGGSRDSVSTREEPTHAKSGGQPSHELQAAALAYMMYRRLMRTSWPDIGPSPNEWNTTVGWSAVRIIFTDSLKS